MEETKTCGINETIEDRGCNKQLNIIARRVRCVAVRKIYTKIQLPSISNIMNSCTGGVDANGGIDLTFTNLRITCAEEKLIDCDTPNPGINVHINGQVIVRTDEDSGYCKPSYMAIPVEILNENIYDFNCCDDDMRIDDLKNELHSIDGSCMTINLKCKITMEETRCGMAYMVTITGKVIDHLWKNDVICVRGDVKYNRNALTVCESFDRGFCGCDNDTTESNDIDSDLEMEDFKTAEEITDLSK